jgi:hypothetical protein
MFNLSLLWCGALVRLFRSRGNLVLENFVLRQQLAEPKRRRPRPRPISSPMLIYVRRMCPGLA